MNDFRREFNGSARDIGVIADILSASSYIASSTDVIEAIGALNTSLSANDLDFSADSGSNGSVTDSQVLDFQGTANQITTTSDGAQQVTFSLADTVNIVTGITNSGMTGTLTFPTIGGVIATEGFGIALAVALG